MNIGRLGVWALVNFMSAPDSAAFARRVEGWGYATGIASIYARDPFAAVNSQYALAEQSGGRFLLGLGVSHGPFVQGVLGHTFEKPVPKMRRYLEAMAGMKYFGPAPIEKPQTVIGALGPKMLEVAAALADGAHPYNVTPEHTAEARRILGPGKLLCPEQMVLLEENPSVARAIAREAIALSLTLPNYRNNYLRIGFGVQDMENGGSDRLVDAIVAWGDERAIRDRVRQHFEAGADHVCIQPLRRGTRTLTADDERVLELLAPG